MMSNRTTDVMQEHLLIAESYKKGLEEAKSKADFINVITTCKDKISAQYKDLEEIADDYSDKILNNKDKELKELSEKVGSIFGKETTAYYGKMGPYMADPDFMKAFTEFDQIIGSNPLFGQSQFGQDVAVEVSKAIAGSLDGAAVKMMAETDDTNEVTVATIAEIMDSFLGLSKRYVAKMDEANTARKIVTATDSYVNAISKMVPEMRSHTDTLRLLMAKDEKPQQIVKIADELKVTLGDDLKRVMQNKEELISDKKVQKSVAKLGEILQKVPF